MFCGIGRDKSNKDCKKPPKIYKHPSTSPLTVLENKKPTSTASISPITVPKSNERLTASGLLKIEKTPGRARSMKVYNPASKQGGRRKTRKKKGSDYSKLAKKLMKQRAIAAAKGDIGRFKGDDFDSKLLHIAEGKAEMDKLKRIHREGHGNIDPETGLAVAPRVPRMMQQLEYRKGLAAKRKLQAEDEAPAAKRIRKITYNGGKRRKKTRKKRRKKKRKTKKRRKRKKRKTKKRYRNQRGCKR